jgi:hypothetical protein
LLISLPNVLFWLFDRRRMALRVQRAAMADGWRSGRRARRFCPMNPGAAGFA